MILHVVVVGGLVSRGGGQQEWLRQQQPASQPARCSLQCVVATGVFENLFGNNLNYYFRSIIQLNNYLFISQVQLNYFLFILEEQNKYYYYSKSK